MFLFSYEITGQENGEQYKAASNKEHGKFRSSSVLYSWNFITQKWWYHILIPTTFGLLRCVLVEDAAPLERFGNILAK